MSTNWVIILSDYQLFSTLMGCTPKYLSRERLFYLRHIRWSANHWQAKWFTLIMAAAQCFTGNPWVLVFRWLFLDPENTPKQTVSDKLSLRWLARLAPSHSDLGRFEARWKKPGSLFLGLLPSSFCDVAALIILLGDQCHLQGCFGRWFLSGGMHINARLQGLQDGLMLYTLTVSGFNVRADLVIVKCSADLCSGSQLGWKGGIQKFPTGTDAYMGVTASFWHATAPFSSSADPPPLPPNMDYSES